MRAIEDCAASWRTRHGQEELYHMLVMVARCHYCVSAPSKERTPSTCAIAVVQKGEDEIASFVVAIVFPLSVLISALSSCVYTCQT